MNDAASYPDFTDRTVSLPATIARNEKTVRDGFWRKLRRNMARVPFAEHAVAVWYCAFDPATPVRAKGVTILWVEHIIMAMQKGPDRLLVVNFGRRLFCGIPEETFRAEEVQKIYLGAEEDDS